MISRKLTIRRGMLLACGIIPTLSAAVVEIDPASRWQVRDYYQAVYQNGEGLSMNWTGSYTTGDSGLVSGAWLEATRARVNFFRNMAGVPGSIVFDDTLNAKCQDAALMMSANNALSHYPPQGWQWWTQDGYEAASKGNLAINSAGPRAIEGYISDHGSTQDPSGNKEVGHRRWVLFPPTVVMGSGDVPGLAEGGLLPANALWVVSQPFPPRPATRDSYVAWPPRGHVPASLVFARWSFSHPGADFSAASVSLQSGGQPVPAVIEYHGSGYGDPTLVWVANGLPTTQAAHWPVPDTDQSVEVTISNVSIGDEMRNFNYTVTIIDPLQAGQDEAAHGVTALATPVVTAPIPFSVAARPWAEAVQGRVLKTAAYSTVHNAEGGINTLTAFISAGYEPVQSGRKASGGWAFHLASPDPGLQALTIPGEFLIGADNPRLEFASSLAWAAEQQYATVEINIGSGDNWQLVWSQSGPVQTNNSFTAVSLDLTQWAGMTVRLRFRYRHTPGALYYPQTDSYVGWAIDNIALTGVRQISSTTELEPVFDSTTIRPVFPTTEPVHVQARSIAFDGVPLDWGPATAVTPEIMTSVTVPAGQWLDDPVLGWMYGYSGSWAYNLAMEGYVYCGAFPWLYTTGGWFYYQTGSVYTGLWIYDSAAGYGFAPPNYGGWYQLLNQSWKRFTP